MTTVTKYTTPAAAGTEIHVRAERHMSTKGGTYRQAVGVVLAADPELARAYGEPAAPVATTATKPTAPVPGPVWEGKDAGAEVHRRTEALRELDAGLTYQRAANLVLAADPALKIAYVRS